MSADVDYPSIFSDQVEAIAVCARRACAITEFYPATKSMRAL